MNEVNVDVSQLCIGIRYWHKGWTLIVHDLFKLFNSDQTSMDSVWKWNVTLTLFYCISVPIKKDGVLHWQCFVFSKTLWKLL